MTQALLWAGSGTGFTFLMTALGAAMVFLFRNQISPNLHRIMLGFAAGVMIAASMWSLLIPAIEEAQELGLPGWLPAAGGSALGILFLVAMDGLLPPLSPELLQSGDRHSAQNVLLILAITLHNIPEGMAVGVSFALAAQGQSELLPAAGALALGIGIQNFPEGAAVALPVYQAGTSKRRAFWTGVLSGAVEPLFGVAVVLAAGAVHPLMPWLLSFAAGAMVYVVVEELVPQAQGPSGTCGFITGFLVMMVLDVSLG